MSHGQNWISYMRDCYGIGDSGEISYWHNPFDVLFGTRLRLVVHFKRSFLQQIYMKSLVIDVRDSLLTRWHT
jgi:hypothetical protein